jgi:hypothetical protein
MMKARNTHSNSVLAPAADRFNNILHGFRLALVVVVLGAPSLSDAQDVDSNLVFILDGSGSMWGRIQGDEMKISAAKSVMGELLRDVPAGVDIGFVAYGHRRKGDCGDIETIAKLGTAPASVAAAVADITPKGKTQESLIRMRAGEYQIVWRQARFSATDVPMNEICRSIRPVPICFFRSSATATNALPPSSPPTASTRSGRRSSTTTAR